MHRLIHLVLTLTLTLALTPALTLAREGYMNTTFVGSHNTPFQGPLPTHNQNLNVTAQLDLGIRFLQAQTHLPLSSKDTDTDTDEEDDKDKELHLCHSSCLLEDAGLLSDYLSLVKTWLDGNGKEVVTLLLTNGDRVDVSSFAKAFETSGLDKLAFVPDSDSDWPSTEDMAESGKRMVVFLDYNANVKVPYILDEFKYFFETPFDVTDASFANCSIDRPPGAKPEKRMYIVNHFLDVDILGVKVPDRAHADKTNAVHGESGIVTQARRCEGVYGRVPNVVLLDFVDRGDVITAQDVLRGD